MNIFAEAMQCLNPEQIDHHNSSLYLLMTTQSMEIVSRYRRQGGDVRQVVCKETGLYWYFIPWAYAPYWQRRWRMSTEKYAWHFIDGNAHSFALRDWSDDNLRRSFSDLKTPPTQKMYPAIRGAIRSILSAHGISEVKAQIAA